MKESYMKFPSYRNNLLEVTKIYHHDLRREEDEVERLGSELEATHVSLKITQKSL